LYQHFTIPCTVSRTEIFAKIANRTGDGSIVFVKRSENDFEKNTIINIFHSQISNPPVSYTFSRVTSYLSNVRFQLFSSKSFESEKTWTWHSRVYKGNDKKKLFIFTRNQSTIYIYSYNRGTTFTLNWLGALNLSSFNLSRFYRPYVCEQIEICKNNVNISITVRR